MSTTRPAGWRGVIGRLPGLAWLRRKRWARATRNARERSRYACERALLAGADPTTSTHSSVIHFSVNKSATQYVKNVLRRCGRTAGLQHADFSSMAFTSDMPYLDQATPREWAGLRHVFRPRGYLYSAFGGLVEPIPEFDAFRVVLVVRDPRDVMTSQYFSTGFSHPLPPPGAKRDAFVEKRAFAQEHAIDAYVLRECGRTRAVLERYLDRVVGRPNVAVLRYEDMVDDFPAWLDRLTRHCGFELDAALRDALIAEAAAIRPRREDPTRHVRRGRPGDHREKLRPETIARLNAEFAAVLDAFGYAHEGCAAMPQSAPQPVH
jgi:hypothetical protein